MTQVTLLDTMNLRSVAVTTNFLRFYRRSSRILSLKLKGTFILKNVIMWDDHQFVGILSCTAFLKWLHFWDFFPSSLSSNEYVSCSPPPVHIHMWAFFLQCFEYFTLSQSSFGQQKIYVYIGNFLNWNVFKTVILLIGYIKTKSIWKGGHVDVETQ